MPSRSRNRTHKHRELRRRVMLPARIRTDTGWGDACILNVSSGGLLIHSGQAPAEGSTIELRHGGHAVTARVAWSDGPRVGLCANGRLPIEQFLLLSESPALRLTARPAERRSHDRR